MPGRRSGSQLRRGLNSKQIVGGWTPAELFTGGFTGSVWWDPSDMDSMYVDGSGTKVTETGQAVMYMDDKSGNGYYLAQTDPVRRPIFRISGSRRYLEFPNTSTYMTTEFNISLNCRTCHGFAMLATTNTNSNFYRFGSLGNPTGSDTTGLASFALYVQNAGTGSPRRFGIRANAANLDMAHGASVPFGRTFYEYELNGTNNGAFYGSGGLITTDGSYSQLNTTSNGVFGIGTHISSNVPSGNGPFVGEWYGYCHVGRVTTESENTNMRAWMTAKLT